MNIDYLIEKNMMTRLSKIYRNKFITRIKDTFSEYHQQIFLASFYGYLNYDKSEFIIDFDDVWKLLGFSRKDNAKRLLEKFFLKEIDYKVLVVHIAAPPIGGAGINKETINLSINTFKKFCLRAGTKKAEEIHDYYIKLEELLQDVINEETSELRVQLNHEVMEKQKIEERLDKVIRASKRKQYAEGDAVYIGRNSLDTNAFKVGISCNLTLRVAELSHGTTSDFKMERIWYTRFNRQIEDAVKKNYEDKRILQRKEFFDISEYDNVSNFIDTLVKVFNDLDRFKSVNIQEKQKKIREIKNPLKLPEKPCSKCNVTKPLEDFNFAKEHVDGRENSCRECVDKLQKEFLEKKRLTVPIPLEKPCTECQVVFPLNNFYVDREKFDGHGTKCKECFKQRQRRIKPKIDAIDYICRKCKITKPLEEFHKLKYSKTGHTNICKTCALLDAKTLYYKKKLKNTKIEEKLDV